MPINLDKFKGRGSDADGKTKQWKDPISGKTGAPGNDPGGVTSIDKETNQPGSATYTSKK
jgi:hypothetical protein